MDEALFEEHRDWVESIARSIKRKLAPSFDLADLMQIALIEHWKRVESFNPSLSVPYRAYAHKPIQGAVLMACRRKHYREAMHEELLGHHLDLKARPDEILLAKERQRNSVGPRERRARKKMLDGLSRLGEVDAYLVRRVYLEGTEIEVFAAGWKMESKALAKRVGAAVRRLRKAATT